MYNDELYHHGILGQKWGVRRFQNYDGTLKEQGKKYYRRYNKTVDKWAKADAKKDEAAKKYGYDSGQFRRAGNKADKLSEKRDKEWDKAEYKFGKAKRKLYDQTLNEIDQGIAEEKRNRQEAHYAKDKEAFNAAQKNIDRGMALTKQYIDAAKKDGFTVSSVQTNRAADKGEAMVAILLAGPAIGGAAMTGQVMAGNSPINSYSQSGYIYSVKKPKQNKNKTY